MLPRVAIVGRPNVGKSSLLNMLAGRRIAIVDDVPGVTRDRVATEIELPATTQGQPPRVIELIDTGGYGVYAGDDELSVLTDDIEGQIRQAMEQSHLVLFVVDAMTGITPLDEQVARLLRQRVLDRRPILLVANKVDDEKYEADALDAAALGFGQPLVISATTQRNKWELIEAINQSLDFDAIAAEPDVDRSRMLLAIVGKRNAGKSTFVNALAGAQRVIASELPGTTRDSVDVRFEVDGRTFTAIDTAGVRKRKSIESDVEYYSMHRALRSVRRADVVMLMIDATLKVSQVDKKLSHEIQKAFKPCVIVINKWDLVEKELKTDDYLEYLTQELRGLDYAPIVFVSAKKVSYVDEAVNMAWSLYEQAGIRVTTGKLNDCVAQILAQRGPSSKLGERAKVYYVTQPSTHPPTIVMFVNKPELFTPQYQRYMINGFRDRLPFEEVPIRLLIRPRSRKAPKDEAPLAQS
jgi:GTP-binding protein